MRSISWHPLRNWTRWQTEVSSSSRNSLWVARRPQRLQKPLHWWNNIKMCCTVRVLSQAAHKRGSSQFFRKQRVTDLGLAQINLLTQALVDSECQSWCCSTGTRMKSILRSLGGTLPVRSGSSSTLVAMSAKFPWILRWPAIHVRLTCIPWWPRLLMTHKM